MKYGIIGMGALGNQIMQFLIETGVNENEFVFFDDLKFNNGYPNSFPFKDYIDDKHSSLKFYIGLGYKHLILKTKIVNRLIKLDRNIPNFIHTTSYIHSSSKIGRAVYIYPGCMIDQNVIIDNGTLLNNSVTISHDSYIGLSCFLAPRVTVAGNVNIGNHVFLGAGTLISNSLKLGDNSSTSIGSIIIQNLGSNKTYRLNKTIDRKLNLK